MSSRVPNRLDSGDSMAHSAFLHLLQGFLLFLSFQENRQQRQHHVDAPATADDNAGAASMDSISARLDTIANAIVNYQSVRAEDRASQTVLHGASLPTEHARTGSEASLESISARLDALANTISIPQTTRAAPRAPDGVNSSVSFSGHIRAPGMDTLSESGQLLSNTSVGSPYSGGRVSSSLAQRGRRTAGPPLRLRSPYASPPPTEWYAVFRGREVGVFRDRRSVIRATRLLPMARYREYASEQHARRAFENALSLNIVRIMSNDMPDKDCNVSTLATGSCSSSSNETNHDTSEELAELDDADEVDELDESMVLVPDSEESKNVSPRKDN